MTYRIETSGDVAALATKIASDQSTGTFVPTPGETPELKARVGARVVEVRKLESVPTPSFPETNPSRGGPYWRGEADIEFPLEAVGTDLAALMTIAISGVFSIKGLSGIRIVDMKLPPEYAQAHPGPQFGIAGSRALTGVKERPIIGTIVKPSLGLRIG
jgi:ribulose-bisphosphate carboxylase large chain